MPNCAGRGYLKAEVSACRQSCRGLARGPVSASPSSASTGNPHRTNPELSPQKRALPGSSFVHYLLCSQRVSAVTLSLPLPCDSIRGFSQTRGCGTSAIDTLKRLHLVPGWASGADSALHLTLVSAMRRRPLRSHPSVLRLSGDRLCRNPTDQIQGNTG